MRCFEITGAAYLSLRGEERPLKGSLSVAGNNRGSLGSDWISVQR